MKMRADQSTGRTPSRATAPSGVVVDGDRASPQSVIVPWRGDVVPWQSAALRATRRRRTSRSSPRSQAEARDVRQRRAPALSRRRLLLRPLIDGAHRHRDDGHGGGLPHLQHPARRGPVGRRGAPCSSKPCLTARRRRAAVFAVKLPGAAAAHSPRPLTTDESRRTTHIRAATRHFMAIVASTNPYRNSKRTPREG